MKKTLQFLTIGAICTISQLGFAQAAQPKVENDHGQRPPRFDAQHAERRSEDLAERFALSAEQQEVLEGIFKRHGLELEAMKEKAAQRREAETSAHREQLAAQLAEVLSPEQIAEMHAHAPKAGKYEEHKDHRAQGKHDAPCKKGAHDQEKRPQGKPAQPDLNKLSEELGLNEEQKAEFTALHKAHFAKVEALQKGEQRPSRKEMESLKKQLEEDLEAILTEKQMKQLKAKQGPKRGRPERR